MFTSSQRAGRDHGAYNPLAPVAGSQPHGPLLARRTSARQPNRDAYDTLRLQPVHSLRDGALCGADLTANREIAGPPPADGSHLVGWLLYAACVQGGLHGVALPISVALPAGTRLDDALIAQTEAALDRSGFSPGLLTIELGEYAMQAAGADTLLALAALRDCGAGVAIGVSQAASGLRTLCRLPVTCLRLHARLVQDLADSRPARDAVERAVEIAHALNAQVIGLGAHTALQRDILADLGVDAANGPIFGPPLPAHAFRHALTALHA